MALLVALCAAAACASSPPQETRVAASETAIASTPYTAATNHADVAGESIAPVTASATPATTDGCQPAGDGLEIEQTVKSKGASEEYDYELLVPQDSTVEKTSEGGIKVIAPQGQAYFEPPRMFEFKCKKSKFTQLISNDITGFTLLINHHGMKMDYPLSAYVRVSGPLVQGIAKMFKKAAVRCGLRISSDKVSAAIIQAKAWSGLEPTDKSCIKSAMAETGWGLSPEVK